MARIFHCVTLAAILTQDLPAQDLVRLQHNDPELSVDLGVGLWAWPLPIDWDGDGDLDLVVSCPDKPYNGTYFFENPGTGHPTPVFRPGRRISRGPHNAQISFVNGTPRVTLPGAQFPDFRKDGFDGNATKIPLPTNFHKPTGKHGKNIRARQWRYADFDGDGVSDLIIGIGDWTHYGWDDAYNAQGEWTRGPLRGFVYWARNSGSEVKPAYETPVKVTAGDSPVDVFGMPSPNLADFDGDGDLDLLCGEFRDGFTYFQNEGTRKKPRYRPGVRLPVRMELCMITPTAIDWDGDGDQDLIVGDEDGRVAWMEHTGKIERGIPVFRQPVYFQQEAADLKFGALATPVGVDWDGDGDQDILAGNTAGQVGFFENLSGTGKNSPRWAAPKLLRAGGETILIQAGNNGSIQGPAETKWGYTTFTVADWDGDGRHDLIANSIWGKVIWYRNTGTKTSPNLDAARAIAVAWTGKPPKPEWNWWDPRGNELVTQWRTTPVAVDWNKDGLTDLVMLDHEGYLALLLRKKTDQGLKLLPPDRHFVKAGGGAIQLNKRRAGGSGRRKLCVVDWDGDGRLDILANSENAELWLNVGSEKGRTVLENQGNLANRKVSGHTSSPTVIDLNADGVPELLVGAEDGRFYHQPKRTPLEGPDKRTIGNLSITSRGVSFETLNNKVRSYSNRKYTWFDVPAKLQGWTFTKTAGGERASIRAHSKTDTTIYFASSVAPQSGWTKTALDFAYTDGGKTRVHVYQRMLAAGGTATIPQNSWTGGILLIPKSK